MILHPNDHADLVQAFPERRSLHLDVKRLRYDAEYRDLIREGILLAIHLREEMRRMLFEEMDAQIRGDNSRPVTYPEEPPTVFRAPGVPDREVERFALDADVTVYWPWVRPCWEPDRD